MQIISTPLAPSAIGPYSQAMRIENTLYCSGQIALDPTTMEMKNDSVESETHQVINNIRGLLSSEGLTLANVFKTTVYLTSMTDFATVNAIYAEAFSHKPARSCVAVAELPKGARVEIEVMARYE